MAETQDPPIAEPAAPQIEVAFGGEREVRIRAVVEDADPDDPRDDGLRLEVQTLGVEHGGSLALLYVINLPAGENPLTAAVKAMIDLKGDDCPEAVEVLAAFADYVGFPMPESGR